MADAGQTAAFRTAGGNRVEFVHEGGPYGYGTWTCNGCHINDRTKVGEANGHAAQCRAE